MRIALLTTETAHHLYFAWKLNAAYPLQSIFIETKIISPPFETAHPFESDRDTYEREVLLKGCPVGFEMLAPTYRCESINERQCVATLQATAPEVAIVFGTGILRAPVIDSVSVACLNLHGGNPEEYRGLDSHLWTIYHSDFDNLITTIHHVDSGLDTGDIVLQSRLPLDSESRIATLRSVNTRLCVDLTRLAIEALRTNGQLPSRSQLRRGRYYSFMPAILKEVCVKSFEKHMARL
jgi:methionyl-tRNA formyltransferase